MERTYTRDEIFQIEDKKEAYRAIDILYPPNTNRYTRNTMRFRYNYFRKHGVKYGQKPPTTQPPTIPPPPSHDIIRTMSIQEFKRRRREVLLQEEAQLTQRLKEALEKLREEEKRIQADTDRLTIVRQELQEVEC
jgi:hypothetical protein